MKYIFGLYTVVFLLTVPVQAQQDRDAIRGAAATATKGVGGAKLPSDSLSWRKGGDVSLSFSQIHLSNWAAGGENSVTLGSVSNLFANYKKDKMIWENYAFLAYGLIITGENYSDKRKNSDQINVGSRAGYKMSDNWYYTAALLGKTQFAPGYKTQSLPRKEEDKISDFLAPLSLYLSLGLDYKPSSRFALSFAPVMGKATLVRSKYKDNPTILKSSGITQDLINEGKHSRYEFGGGLIMSMNGAYFEKKVTYSSQIEFFSNYINNPQNIDVVWDFQCRVALAKHISAGMRINMIYDDDQKTIKTINEETVIGPAQLQVKQFFEIGLFYGF